MKSREFEEAFDAGHTVLGLSDLTDARRVRRVEVSQASSKGFWLLLGDEELFVPFAEFPWFKKVTMEELASIEWPTPDHLYWPLIDVDLSVESIRHPERFPLRSLA